MAKEHYNYNTDITIKVQQTFLLKKENAKNKQEPMWPCELLIKDLMLKRNGKEEGDQSKILRVHYTVGYIVTALTWLHRGVRGSKAFITPLLRL